MKKLLMSSMLLPSLFMHAKEISFNKDIRPILSDKCFACHGPDAHDIKGKLQLHTSDLATKERHYTSKSGKKKILDAVIIPGNAKDSLLWERLITDDEDEIMPPPKSHKTLSQKEKETIKQWINNGAEYENHWSYEEVKTAKPNDSVDSLISENLKSSNLDLNKPADKITLIRRLSLDIRGLAPSQEEINAFLADKSSSAWEKLIDSYLADPAFGEKMAVHWLDIVRFADTVGYHGDQNQRVFPYRDYVIKSFNSNKGFDAFTREQLAGDLLQEKPTEEQLVATAYNRLNMMTSEGGAQAKEYLTKYAGDRVRTTTTAWMGSTLGCAECHDHKYDPFTAKDYYAFAAFFADIKQSGVYQGQDKYGYKYPPLLKVKDPEKMKAYLPLKKQIEDLENQIKSKAQTSQVKQDFEAHKKTLEIMNKTQILTVTSSNSAEFTKQKDGSFLRKNKATKSDSYIIKINQDTAAQYLNLSMLADPTYRNKIGIGNGNIVLTSINVNIIKGAEKQAIKILDANADYSQNQFSIKSLISGKQNQGWALDAHQKKFEGIDRHAVLQFEQAIKGNIEVQLHFNSPYANHIPGRFALSLSSEKLNPEVLASSRINDITLFTKNHPDFKELYIQLDSIKKRADQLDYGMTDCQITETVKPMTIKILPRGNWQDESGEVVQPAIPSFLGKINKEGRANRLDLANWLVSKDNPLTARVFVNRLWYLYFGRGLSQVVEDLGSQGETPDNPELLDYLAWHFMNDNWDVKKAVKRILMSKAYRQSTEASPQLVSSDPFNKKLARQNARRLEAEFIRDNILDISGLLNKKIGGRSIKPYQPAGYYSQLNFPKRTYVADTDANQYRKGLYIHRQRTFLHPMLKAFDTPSADICNARRSVSNTPLQSLALLNDPSFLEAAGAFAQRALNEKSDNKIKWMIETALTRPASPSEIKELLEFHQEQKTYFTSSPSDADKFLHSLKIKDPNQYDKIELASYGSVARLIFNLHETLSVY